MATTTKKSSVGLELLKFIVVGLFVGLLGGAGTYGIFAIFRGTMDLTNATNNAIASAVSQFAAGLVVLVVGYYLTRAWVFTAADPKKTHRSSNFFLYVLMGIIGGILVFGFAVVGVLVLAQMGTDVNAILADLNTKTAQGQQIVWNDSLTRILVVILLLWLIAFIWDFVSQKLWVFPNAKVVVEEEAAAPLPEAKEEEVKEEAKEEPAPAVIEEPKEEKVEEKVEEKPVEEPKEEVKSEEPKEEAKEEEPVEEVKEETKEEPAPKPAPAKKAPAKKPAAKKAQEPKVVGKYEVYPVADVFQFRLKANNGEILVVSNGYTTRDGALRGIETFKKNVPTGVKSVQTDKNNYSQWRLFTPNDGRLIATGEVYSTLESAQNALASVEKFYDTDKIVDLDELPEEEIREWKADVSSAESKAGGKIEYFVDEEANGKWRARLKANNGQVMFTTDSAYVSKAAAIKGIEAIKKQIEANAFHVVKDKQGRFQFVLSSTTGAVLVRGESYDNKDQAISAANSVASFIKEAKVIDTKAKAKEEAKAAEEKAEEEKKAPAKKAPAKKPAAKKAPAKKAPAKKKAE